MTENIVNEDPYRTLKAKWYFLCINQFFFQFPLTAAQRQELSHGLEVWLMCPCRGNSHDLAAGYVNWEGTISGERCVSTEALHYERTVGESDSPWRAGRAKRSHLNCVIASDRIFYFVFPLLRDGRGAVVWPRESTPWPFRQRRKWAACFIHRTPILSTWGHLQPPPIWSGHHGIHYVIAIINELRA